MTTGIGVDRATEISPKDFERMLLRTLTAMKKGDFKVRMPVEFTGAQGKIADTLNDIIELSERTTSEVERISTVVGKEGKLSARAQVPSANGQWVVLAESVNSLIAGPIPSLSFCCSTSKCRGWNWPPRWSSRAGWPG